MTMDDAFDARLKAAFAAAQEPLDHEEESRRFAEKVSARLAKPNRKRAIILGGAGSTGSAIAGTQLEGALGQVQGASATASAAEGSWNMLLTFGSPEVMAAAALALAGLAVVLILPRRLMA
jgi:hypothetical protein